MIAPRNASVAQLDRVLPSEGRGRGFESRRMRHLPQVLVRHENTDDHCSGIAGVTLSGARRWGIAEVRTHASAVRLLSPEAVAELSTSVSSFP